MVDATVVLEFTAFNVHACFALIGQFDDVSLPRVVHLLHFAVCVTAQTCLTFSFSGSFLPFLLFDFFFNFFSSF